MVARTVLAADRTIDTRILQAGRYVRAEKKMVKPKSCITLPAIAQIVPERVDALPTVAFSDRIGPGLADTARVASAAPRLHQGVFVPRRGRIDVNLGRGDVEVACQHDRN